MVAAVDLIGYSPDTFDDNATSAFEITTAEVVGVLADAVEVSRVNIPIYQRRSILERSCGVRVDFVIKTANAEKRDVGCDGHQRSSC